MSSRVTIPTQYGGVSFKNPIMPAAGPFGAIAEYADFGDLSSLGALVPNSFEICENQPSTTIKYHYTAFGFLSSFNRNNIDFAAFAETVLPNLPHSSAPVIIDMKAKSMAEMVEFAKIISQYDAIAGVEINLNCPYAVSGTTPYWRTPGQVKLLMQRVREVIGDRLLFAKVPSAECPIEELAAEAEQGGAHAIVTFNGIIGAAVNIETRRFVSGIGGSGGYSGPGIKPIGVQWCKRAHAAVSIPVIAAGGIRCAEDVLEYMMAGATMVQVGSAILAQPSLLFTLVTDFSALLKKMQIEDVNEIIGVAKPI